MSSQYKKDEKIMKDIIKRNVSTTDPNNKLKFCIYYKNLKTKNLIMKNNITQENLTQLHSSWSVYQYKCPSGDCELPNPTYIGQTRNTIITRLKQHTQDGAISQHHKTKHNTNNITLDHLIQNTVKIKQFSDYRSLVIYEALIIQHRKPSLNRQIDNFINPLKLYAHSSSNSTQHNHNIQDSQHNYNLRPRHNS